MAGPQGGLCDAARAGNLTLVAILPFYSSSSAPAPADHFLILTVLGETTTGARREC